jgi:GT2 family glycosyltransferase
VKSQPFVYILILNWNGWEDTLECLTSLKKLDYKSAQIVVMDNASTNDSVMRIREAFPNITLIETGGNLGFSKGNNVGMRYALSHNADYVWLLNNDTTVEQNTLSALVKVAEKNSEIGAVGSLLYYMHNPSILQTWGGGKVNLWTGRPKQVKQPAQLDYLSGASLLIKREVLEKVGLFPDDYFMYWEDVDFGFSLRKAGWHLGVAEDSRVFHKDSGTTGRNSVLLDRYFSETLVTFLYRHAPVPLIPLILSVGRRVLLRLVRGQWERAKAVVEGTFAKL